MPAPERTARPLFARAAAAFAATIAFAATWLAQGCASSSSTGAGAETNQPSTPDGATSPDSPGTGGTGGAAGTSGAGGGGTTRSDSGGGGNPPGDGAAPARDDDTGTSDSAGVHANGGCAPPSPDAPYSFACWPMPNPAATGLPHPSSYTDLGDGAVQDNVTGLVWQKAVTSSQAYAWSDAESYCAGLDLAGRVWRLPTRIELLSIVDFTRVGPALDVAAFPGTPSGKYHWTSSPWVVSQIATKPQYSWIVNFYEGLTSNAGDRTALEYARCVSSSKSGPMPSLYTEPSPGEVADGQTGLTWVAATSATTMSQADAATYCANLALNGHSWRLPSIKELSTLVEENPPIAHVSPAIDTTLFADTKANGWYMSSSAWAGPADKSSSGAWAINFEDGFTDPGYSSHFTTGWVRCVR